MRNLAGMTFSLSLLATALSPAQAADTIRIGMIVTLSGPSAVLGQQVRDGFTLALRDRGGRMGGKEVELLVVDDQLKPDIAAAEAREMVERGKVDFVVGPIFSNVLQAIHRPVTGADVILVSPNAGTSTYAGKGCNPNFFVTSYQNDQVFGVLGKVAQDRGYRRVYLLAPNYQAGRDAIAGFKRHYQGEVVEESYAPLNNLDFQPDLAKIATMKPDALFTFMPGGMGISLVKQYSQAGLAGRVPFLSAFTVDEATLPAQQDAALGMFGGMTWAPDADNPQSRKFVDDYLAAYGAMPGSYAMQAHDAAALIGSALDATKGETADKAALREAMRRAEFKSLRGDFRFGANNFPIQDFYLVKAGKRPDGRYQTEIVEKVFDDQADDYAKECKPAS
jgi:branched-chain amino acid transport system substrate-binding protein